MCVCEKLSLHFECTLQAVNCMLPELHLEAIWKGTALDL